MPLSRLTAPRPPGPRLTGPPPGPPAYRLSRFSHTPEGITSPLISSSFIM